MMWLFHICQRLVSDKYESMSLNIDRLYPSFKLTLTVKGQWELVSGCQPKCPNPHRWVTWGTCLLEEMETKPGVDGRTNHSTILILLGYHITDWSFPKIFRTYRSCFVELNNITFFQSESPSYFVTTRTPKHPWGHPDKRKTIVVQAPAVGWEHQVPENFKSPQLLTTFEQKGRSLVSTSSNPSWWNCNI